MRIIKEGQVPPEKEIVATCSNCQTEFAFYLSEAGVVGNVAGGKKATKYAINCPLCKGVVHIDLESIQINWESCPNHWSRVGENALNDPSVPSGNTGGLGYEAMKPSSQGEPFIGCYSGRSMSTGNVEAVLDDPSVEDDQ